MNITGHHSSKAVRLYKEISHEQQQETSEVIQHAKKFKVEPNASTVVTSGDKIKLEPTEAASIGCTTTTSMTSTVSAADKTPVFNFNLCHVVFHN